MAESNEQRERRLYREWFKTARKHRTQYEYIAPIVRGSPAWDRYIAAYERHTAIEHKKFESWKTKRAKQSEHSASLTASAQNSLGVDAQTTSREPSHARKSSTSSKPAKRTAQARTNSARGRKSASSASLFS